MVFYLHRTSNPPTFRAHFRFPQIPPTRSPFFSEPERDEPKGREESAQPSVSLYAVSFPPERSPGCLTLPWNNAPSAQQWLGSLGRLVGKPIDGAPRL
jgi:hypothetical protein